VTDFYVQEGAALSFGLDDRLDAVADADELSEHEIGLGGNGAAKDDLVGRGPRRRSRLRRS
jgi:hypothetical protein